jgi:CRISPR-associated protein Cas1
VIKRTIEISQQPLHLAVQRQQLVLRPPGLYTETVASIPCEDIGLVVVDHPQSTYTHAALVQLLDAGAVLVICDSKHLPAGVLLPFANHTEVIWRLQDQIGLPKPARKRLWQQLVVAKIRNQAAQLNHEPDAQRHMRALASTVRSGDPANVEAQAARVYWDSWLDEQAGFQRRCDGGDVINILLNYGYAVVRAAVARALVGAGLHPALGLHHSNRGQVPIDPEHPRPPISTLRALPRPSTHSWNRRCGNENCALRTHSWLRDVDRLSRKKRMRWFVRSTSTRSNRRARLEPTCQVRPCRCTSPAPFARRRYTIRPRGGACRSSCHDPGNGRRGGADLIRAARWRRRAATYRAEWPCKTAIEVCGKRAQTLACHQ